MAWPKSKWARSNEVREKTGFRSGLELAIAKQLKAAGVDFEYETQKIKYTIPEHKSTYTPDFILPNGIIIEAKGAFDSKDRTKHRLIKAEYPELDIRFVFSNPHQKIGKKSDTTYAMWCERLGIPWAAKLIPPKWIAE